MGRDNPSPAPGRITALRFQKRTKDRVNLYIDDHFAMGLPAIEAARLKVGQVLDADDIKRLERLDARQQAYDRAVRFLSYRPRSIAEVRRYLQGKGVEESDSETIIARLIDLQYLDDGEFARWWVENRTEFSPRGPYAIRQELRLKGVADDVIAEAIARFGPNTSEVVESLGRQRAHRLAGEDQAAFRRKLSSFLLRRGFSYADVTPVVEQLWEEIETARDASERT